MQLLPRVIFYKIDVFEDEISKTDLSKFINVSCIHENVLIYGRYLKLSRDVSQTPWLVEGVNSSISKTSVQCEIAKEIKDVFKPAFDEFYLHAAGREDIDVRMLGTGRPFIFEFVNPKRAYTPQNQIESCSVNSKSVKVKDFKIVDKEFFEKMKEIES